MNAVESSPPEPDAAGLTPGKRLAAARAAQNLSPADVARQLKLSVSQVEALESGLYQQLPGPIFVRGFIRNYARLVKLDPNELLQAAGDTLPQATARPEAPRSQDIPFPAAGRPRWKLAAFGAAAIVCVLAIYEFYWNEPESPAQPAPAASAPKMHRSHPEPARPDGAVSQTGAPAASEGKAVAMAPAAQPERAPAIDAGPAVQPAADKKPRRGERQVRLAFDQECWVEIRDRDEKVIFSQLNRPGTQQSVSGMPPFSVVLGNAHGVRLTYDEKPVDLAPHTKIDVARLILP